MDEEGARKMLGEIEEAFHTLDDEKLRHKYDDKIGVSHRAADRPVQGGFSQRDDINSVGAPARLLADDTSAPHVGEENSGIITSIMHKKYTPVKRAADAGVGDVVKEKLAELVENNDLGDGSLYRQIREFMGITLKEVHNYIRVMEIYLVAIEENNYGTLPPPVYTRGFIKSYLQYLGISQVEPFVTRYMEHYSRWSKKPAK
jgi:hypothetical protein